MKFSLDLGLPVMPEQQYSPGRLHLNCRMHECLKMQLFCQ